MYIIVAKKTERDTGDFPIIDALKWYFKKNTDDIILVSPGYMSKTSKTVKDFYCEFNHIQGASANNKFIFSYGMNGNATLTDNKNTTIIDEHANYFKFSTLNCFSTKKDHSKFLIFIKNNEDFINEYDKSESNLIELLKNDNLNVKAILLGSSNFSYNTYFSGYADKGEADIFMIDENLYTEENFIGSFSEFYNMEQSNGRIILSKEIGTKNNLNKIANKLILNN